MTPNRRTILMGALGSALFPATGARAEGRDHKVSIRNFTFEPETQTVAVGDRILFINEDLAPHTATADDGSWDTGALEQGQSKQLIVADDWTPTYFCAFHPAMTGRLNIG
ncbi:copper-binding protein [uncultured Roseovarius sp.]|uniref:copper-binding protein n=1 Tax=uncultured Roseovarius sp. TaxID=293344 RepID=UPI002637A5EA|nr:copper-binding protein [uncultured Roseovarius sp.]